MAVTHAAVIRRARHLPIHTDSGAAEVDLIRATLTPLPQGIPQRSLALHVDQPAGYHTDRFEVEDLTAVAAREYVNPGFRLVLHRWRGGHALPDVMVGGSPQSSDAISVSVDRLHVLGVIQIPAAAPRYRYDIRVFSTVTGLSVGQLASDVYPATFAVWDHRLISFIPDRVAIGDLATGRSLYQWTVRDIRYHGTYPPAMRR